MFYGTVVVVVTLTKITQGQSPLLSNQHEVMQMSLSWEVAS